MLKFLGRRSAFHEEQNNSYFIDGDRLVMLDCAMNGFHVIRREGLKKLAEAYRGSVDAEEPKEFVILVTHTHGDHIGGIPMLIHYAYYVLKKPVTVVAPSEEVKEDMDYLLRRMEGCAQDGYRLLTVEEAGYEFVKAAILTEHVPDLAGRCFGYQLELEGRNVIYTGDSCTLKPFLPYITEGTVLYTEVSAFDTPVHLYVERLLEQEEFLREKKAEVYLMHLDDEDLILGKTKSAGYQPAPLVTWI